MNTRNMNRPPESQVKNLFGEGSLNWLRQDAKRMGIKGYTRMTKAELQHRVAGDQSNIIGHTKKGIPLMVTGGVKPKPADPISGVKNLYEPTTTWMREDAKRMGFGNYAKLRKGELQDIMSGKRRLALSDLKLQELKELANARDIAFGGRVRKSELVDMLSAESDRAPRVEITTTFVDSTTDKTTLDVSSYQSANIEFLWDEVKPSIISKLRQTFGKSKKMRMSVEAVFTHADHGGKTGRFWGTPGERARVILQSTNLDRIRRAVGNNN